MAKENVNHPSHYRSNSGIEVIDAIEAWNLNFSRGNAIKYIARAGMKDSSKEIEDLEKARWYIDREIQRLHAKDNKWFSTEEINEIYSKFYKEERLYPSDNEERIFENGKEIK